MVRLDTFKVSIPECTIEDFDKCYFNIIQSIDGDTGELKINTYKLKDDYRLLGISNVEVKQSGRREEIKVVCEI